MWFRNELSSLAEVSLYNSFSAFKNYLLLTMLQLLLLTLLLLIEPLINISPTQIKKTNVLIWGTWNIYFSVHLFFEGLPEVYAKMPAGHNENVDYVLTEVGMRWRVLMDVRNVTAFISIRVAVLKSLQTDRHTWRGFLRLFISNMQLPIWKS